MRLLRRLIGLLGALAGLIGLLLCIAGIVGCWVLYSDVVGRVDRAFGRVDGSLTNATENIDRVGDRLRRTQTELSAIQKREADLASQPAEERNARRALTLKSFDSIKPHLGEAREKLLVATEISLVLNGLLEALAELPTVERLNIDTDRLKEMSGQLSEAIDRSDKMAVLLAKAAPNSGTETAGEASRVSELLNRIIVAVDGAGERVGHVRVKIDEGHDRMVYWTTAAAVVITALLVWIGIGQLSLLIQGRAMVRR